LFTWTNVGTRRTAQSSAPAETASWEVGSNAEAVRELEAITPYGAPGQTIPINDIMSSVNGLAITAA